MIIRRLKVRRYGVLRDCTLNLNAGLNIIQGPNEAGKSTLFDLLTSLLYGFSPATSAKHPYTPWEDEAHLDILAEIVLQDGKEVQCRRRLLSVPRGSLTCEGGAEEIANRALPFAQHVGRDLYRSLYALTAYDFRDLEKSQDDQIRERLLGGLTVTRFRPVFAVLNELDRDAKQLWRTDRRGRPRSAELSEQLKRVRQERQRAVQQEAELQSRLSEMEQARGELQDVENSRAELKAGIRRAEVLVPVARSLAQLKEWQRELGDPRRLDALPKDIRAELTRLENSIREKGSESDSIAGQVREKEALAAGVDDLQLGVLAKAEEIRDWVRKAQLHDDRKRQIDGTRRDLERLKTALTDKAAEVLSKAWSAGFSAPLMDIPPAELKGCLNRYDQSNENHRSCREARIHKENNPPPEGRSTPLWLGAGALITGILFVLTDLAFAAGLAVCAVGAFFLLQSYLQNQSQKHVAGQYARDLQLLKEREKEAEGELGASRKYVTDLLAGLPVAASLLEKPDINLYYSLMDLRGKVTECETLQRDLDEMEGEWQKDRQQLVDLAGQLGELADEAAVTMAERLKLRLDEAKSRQENAAQASEEMEQLRARRKTVQNNCNTLIKERDALLTEVLALAEVPFETTEGLGDSDLADAVAKVTKLQETLSLLQHHEEQLQKEHVDLSQLVMEIKALEQQPEAKWLLNPTEVELAKQRLDELERGSQEIYKNIAELNNDIKQLKQGPSPGELDGQTETLVEQLEIVTRERDRLALMAKVLQEADHQFREEHQPDVLRRASSYIETITGSRYRRLLIQTTEGGSEELVVERSEDSQVFRVAPPLSRGTLDQVFLAFRLGVIDHLDQGHETLPLFLDEGLVNWDDNRLENGIRLLGTVSSNRQVVLFTCRSHLADLVCAKLGQCQVCKLG